MKWRRGIWVTSYASRNDIKREPRHHPVAQSSASVTEEVGRKMNHLIQTHVSRIKAAVVFVLLVAVLISSGHAVAEGLNFKLGGARKVPPPLQGVPIYSYAPDGHYTVLSEDSTVWMFWPGQDSYRSSGTSIFEMYEPVKVLPRGPSGSFDSGGAWLYTVLRGSEDRMLGFYHAEDRTFPLSPGSDFIAYKSIARCVSEDLGLTWKNREQILTAHAPKPKRAKWSGLGDHCIVWDPASRRLVCFFQEEGYLSMAASSDSQGRAGTWRKWYRGGFTEPGLGGRATALPAFAKHPGGNPSVLWNTYLERWLITWHTWRGDLWISSSTNLMDWSPPKILLKRPWPRGRVWYPTLIGQSDKIGGENLWLLYAEFPVAENSERHFLARKLRLKKTAKK